MDLSVRKFTLFIDSHVNCSTVVGYYGGGESTSLAVERSSGILLEAEVKAAETGVTGDSVTFTEGHNVEQGGKEEGGKDEGSKLTGVSCAMHTSEIMTVEQPDTLLCDGGMISLRRRLVWKSARNQRVVRCGMISWRRRLVWKTARNQRLVRCSWRSVGSI